MRSSRRRADGSLTIAQSFQPAKEEPPPPPKKKTSGLDLSLSHIAVEHAWIHGGLSALPIIDANLDDVAASLGMTPDTTSVDLRRLRLSTRGLPKSADVGANLEAHLVLPADVAKMTGSVVFVGTVGGIGLGIHGLVDGKKVDGAIDVPTVVPSQLDRLLGESPLHQVASAHVEAHGVLPHVQPAVHLKVGDGTIDSTGDVTLPSDDQPDTLARIAVVARDLDARAAAPTGAPSNLEWTSRPRRGSPPARSTEPTISTCSRARMGPSRRPTLASPGPSRRRPFEGTGHIAIPGVPSEVHYQVSPVAKGGPDIAFDATVRAKDLSRIPKLGRQMNGRAIVHASGRLALGTRQVTAHVESSIDRFNGGVVGVQEARLTATVQGTLDDPSAAVSVAGHGIRAVGHEYPFFHVNAAGKPGEIALGATLEGARTRT